MFKLLIIASVSLVVCNAASLVRVSRDSNSYEPSYESYSPQPYKFGYETVDDYGNKLSRNEEGDGYGNVKGSYSYRTDKGIYRTVEYTADKGGFRAQVKTNEPGTERSNPADVYYDANPIVIPYVPRTYQPEPYRAPETYKATESSGNDNSRSYYRSGN